MQYNNGLSNSLVADVHYWAGTDSTTYPISDMTRNANAALDRVVALIIKHDNSWEWDDNNNTDLPIATKSLVSGQSDYTLSVSHLKLLKVRVKDQNGNWITLKPISRRSLTDNQLAATGTPEGYDKLGSSIFVYPTPNYDSSAGLEAQFQRGGDYFLVTDDTKSPGFASIFHRLVSLYTALDYTDPNDLDSRSAKIRDRIAKMEADLADFYSQRDYDRPQNIGVETNDYGQLGMI